MSANAPFAPTLFSEPLRSPDLAPQRERLTELDPDLSPRLGAPARVQHHAQHAVDAEPGVPEAGVGVHESTYPQIFTSMSGVTTDNF
jgi:hypothetical protein